MAEPSWMQEARKLEGLKEIIGSKHEARVVEFFAEAGHSWVKDDETAWCMAFANAMLARAGWKGTGKLNARSALDWGQVIDRVDIQPGDFVIMKRGTSSWQGHITMYVDGTAKTFRGLGGNQSNAVTVTRYKWDDDILGVRRPNERIDTKAPDRAANDMLRMGMMDNKRVKALQEQLVELGYVVGAVDGDFGKETRNAVLAWKADRGLPLNPDVSPSDLDKLDASEPRQVSEARAAATIAEVKAVDRSVKNDDNALKTVAATTVAVGAPTAADQTGVLDGLKDTADKVGAAKDIVEQTVSGAKTLGIDVAAFISSHSTLLLICGLAVAAFFVLKSMRARVEDHREGRKL